jgi:hypothetical protein
MPGFIKFATLIVVKTAMVSMAAGCQLSAVDDLRRSSPQMIAGTSGSQQLIIKFRPGTLSCDPAGIACLSSTTHVALEFVRPMSGDACVVKHLANDSGSFSQGQQVLRQHPAIEWVEPDAVMKAS